MATIDTFDTIRAFVEAGWPDGVATCPLAWDNEPFKAPAPFGPTNPATGQAVANTWGKVLVDGDLWSQQTIGTGDPATERWDETGSLLFFAFQPTRTGSRPVRQLLTAFAELCRGREIEGAGGTIEFQDIRFDPIGAEDETGAWWGMHITIEFVKRG